MSIATKIELSARSGIGGSKPAKVALITGAGGGIGIAVASVLAKDGFDVILAGRQLKKIEKAKQSIGDKAFTLIMDVSDPASIKKGFGSILKDFGRLDLLFNNAGTGVPGSILFEDIKKSDWAKVVNTNLSGSFFCTQEAFRLMKSQKPKGGRIINNGSISAYVPRPNSAPYTATKHAITGLTRSASLDGRKYNIAVGQIDIGNAETDMTKNMPSGVLQADGKIVPEPVMDVANVAQVVSQMAALPLDANVQFVTVMATKMPFIGRG